MGEGEGEGEGDMSVWYKQEIHTRKKMEGRRQECKQ